MHNDCFVIALQLCDMLVDMVDGLCFLFSFSRDL